jgi:hypothetical protein
MLGRYCADLGQGATLLYGSGRCVSIGRLTSFSTHKILLQARIEVGMAINDT